MQLDKIVFNILPMYLFAGSELNLKDRAAAASAVMEPHLTVEGLLDIAQRARTLIRLFNAREGFGRADDTLPDRLFDGPSTQGHSSGETVDRTEFERLLTEYYNLVGWEPRTGMPTAETVAGLGLGQYA